MSRRAADSADEGRSSLASIGRTQQPEGASPWTGVDERSLYNCVSSVTARGDALLLGTTSDGGAMTLQVFSGKDRRRFYENDPAAMTALLHDIQEWAENA